MHLSKSSYGISPGQKQVSLSKLRKSGNPDTILSMKTLILETATEKGLIVLAENGSPLAVKPLTGGPGLSKSLALEVKNLLTSYSFAPDSIAVGTGPGSYTGIRVGAALAKSLAFGWQIPLIGFCSLIAFAPSDQYTVLIDARIGGFYVLHPSSSFEASAVLLSLSAAESELKDRPLLASPHPELIQKRLALPGNWAETSPDPDKLSILAHTLLLKEDSTPLTLAYLSCP